MEAGVAGASTRRIRRWCGRGGCAFAALQLTLKGVVSWATRCSLHPTLYSCGQLQRPMLILLRQGMCAPRLQPPLGGCVCCAASCVTSRPLRTRYDQVRQTRGRALRHS